MFRRVLKTSPRTQRTFTAMEMLERTYPDYVGAFRDIDSRVGTPEEALGEALDYVARQGVHSLPLDQVKTLEGLGTNSVAGSNEILLKDVSRAMGEELRQIPAWKKKILAVGTFACAGSLGISTIVLFSNVNDPSLSAPVYAASSVFTGWVGVKLLKSN